MNGTPTASRAKGIARDRNLPDYPRFTKAGQMFAKPASMSTYTPGTGSGVGPYWPSVLRIDTLRKADGTAAVASPQGKYYCYFSTDHAGTGMTAGGIWMAYADSPLGPWSHYGSAAVFTDSTEGSQCETPSVIWNDVTNLFHLYYHNFNAGNNQSTLLATSTDGISFTRYNRGDNSAVVIDIPDNVLNSDSHTGYARVRRFGRLWVATHRTGGTDGFCESVSYSHDGLWWYTDPRGKWGDNQFASGAFSQYVLGVPDYFQWRGQLYALLDFRASQTLPKTDSIYMAPVAPDYRTFIGRPWEAIARGGTGAIDERAASSACAMVEGDRLYVFYNGQNSSDVNVIAAAYADL